MPAMTTAVKEELVHVRPVGTSAVLAEMSAMFRVAGGISIHERHLDLEAGLSHRASAERLWDCMRRVFNVEPALIEVSGEMRNGQRFVVTVSDDAERIARKLGLLDMHGRQVLGLSHRIMSGTKADAAAAWRGAFLARGSLMEPGRNAALEVVCPRMEAAYALGGLARRLDIPYRVRESRGSARVDIRGGEAISDMLARMGAHDAVLQWEELRVEREVKGSANRLANFDDANIRRSAAAAVTTVIRVERAFEILGTSVPDNLRAAGNVRLAYPSDSLAVLGEHLDPPASKDAVAGRLRRLTSLADKEAVRQGIPTTMDAVAEQRGLATGR